MCEPWDFDWFHKTPTCLYGDCIGCGQALRGGSIYYRGYCHHTQLSAAKNMDKSLEELEWRSLQADHLEAPIAPRFQHQFYCVQCYRQAASREKASGGPGAVLTQPSEEVVARRQHLRATVIWASFCILIGLILYTFFAPKTTTPPVPVTPKIITHTPDIAPPGADTALRKYYEYISADQFAQAYALRSKRAISLGLEDGKSLAEFQSNWSANIWVSLESCKIVSQTGHTADLSVLLRSTERIGQGKSKVQTFPFRFHMVLEDNQWHFDGGTNKNLQ
ncbi:hypothetical protein IV102_25570 [bacterium]|nr:hypothetical protein [bacterium]